jgi:putative ABC transport system permease protein
MRTRSELRGRWRSTVLIVLLIGVIGGVALTAAAGARRTETAYPRFLQATRAADFLVSAYKAGGGVYADIAKLPEVALSGRVDGLPYVYSPSPGRFEQNVAVIASHDGKAGYDVERLHMLSGRAPRPSRANEVAVSLSFHNMFHVGAGDRLVTYQVSPANGKPVLGADGRPIRQILDVTGVEVSFDEIVPIAPQDSLPQVFATPALARRFPRKSMLNYDGLVVRLRPGADVTKFRTEVQRLFQEHPESGGHQIADEIDHGARVENAIRPEAIALAIFALLASLAGLLAIAQILSRRIFLDGSDYPTLRFLGMSRNQLVTVAAIRGMLLGAAGGLVAVAVAILASPLMPIGPARIAEPHRGFEANLAILGIGFGVLVLSIGTVAAFAGWRAARANGTTLGTVEILGGDRPSRVAARVSKAGLGPSVTSGVRFALEPGRGRTAVPVRTALLGIVVAVAAITASFTFGANLSRLVSTPSQYGRTWDADLDTGFGGMTPAKITRTFGGDPDILSYAGGTYGSVSIHGRQIPAVGIDSLKGSLFPTVVAGRPPLSPQEIALGAKTLNLIGASIGQTVTVRTPIGESRMRIVGQVVFPAMGQGSFTPTGLGEGAATVARVFPPPFFPPDDYSFVLARFAPGVNRTDALHRLASRVKASGMCPIDQQCGLRTVQLPAELSTYSNIKIVPLVLALLLILMGIAVTVHTLVTSVQRRRRDLATLKTIGFVRPQVMTTVTSQASVFAVIGLALGIPLGIAAGRWAWTAFAQQLGVPTSPVVPIVMVALAVPATLLLAILAAALPGRSAARTSPAVVLRTE